MLDDITDIISYKIPSQIYGVAHRGVKTYYR